MPSERLPLNNAPEQNTSAETLVANELVQSPPDDFARGLDSVNGTILEPGIPKLAQAPLERPGFGATTLEVPGIVPSNALSSEMITRIEESASGKPHIWDILHGKTKASMVIKAGVITLLTGAGVAVGYELMTKDRYRSREAYKNYTKKNNRLKVARAGLDNDTFTKLRKVIKRRNKDREKLT